MARGVIGKLHAGGAGDIDRAEKLAGLVMQDPLMKLAIANQMKQKQDTDRDIVDCIANLLGSLKGAEHHGPLPQDKEAVRALIARARYVTHAHTHTHTHTHAHTQREHLRHAHIETTEAYVNRHQHA